MYDAMEARCDRMTEQYYALVTQMLDMKRQGFEIKAPVQPLKPSESALPAEVEFAIEGSATGNPQLKRYLMNYAQSALATNTPTDRILHAIRYGDSEDEE